MARSKRTRASLPPGLRDEASKRNNSQKLRYLMTRDDNCELNIQGIIERARRSAAFGAIDWEEASWDASASEAARGHKSRRAVMNFTQHRQAGCPEKTGQPFNNDTEFADLTKAIIRLRREIGQQCVNNQNEVILAFRYLYDALENVNHDIRRASAEHFEAAARSIKQREKETTAHKRLEKLAEIARISDENGLTRVPLHWSLGKRTRPAGLAALKVDDPAAELAWTERLPHDGVLEGVAHLYKVIPTDAWADRLRICLIVLLVITGLRIGELLTLRARRLQAEDKTGHRYFVYFPEKGAPPQQKWLMTAAAAIAEEVIDEILCLTSEARAMAQWLHEHPGEIQLASMDTSQPTISLRSLKVAIGTKNIRKFLDSRGIPQHGQRQSAFVHTRALVETLHAESFAGPVHKVPGTGEELLLKDLLTCVFKNAFRSEHPVLTYAVLPLSEQQLTDFISGRAGQKACFEKYNVYARDGSILTANSHAFRHWLNDRLDKGGLSDLEQAVYFGRRNPADNRAYQHMTPVERTRKARKDLLNGSLLGPVADAVRRLPIERREAALRARVQAVHIIPGGICLHDYSQFQCPNHMGCTDGCGDFHWSKDDAVQARELHTQEQVLEVAIEASAAEVEDGTFGASNWLDYNRRSLNGVRRALADCDGKKPRATNA